MAEAAEVAKSTNWRGRIRRWHLSAAEEDRFCHAWCCRRKRLGSRAESRGRRSRAARSGSKERAGSGSVIEVDLGDRKLPTNPRTVRWSTHREKRAPGSLGRTERERGGTAATCAGGANGPPAIGRPSSGEIY